MRKRLTPLETRGKLRRAPPARPREPRPSPARPLRRSHRPLNRHRERL